MKDDQFYDALMRSSYGEYERLLQYILTHGRKKSDRTGTGTTSMFGLQMRFNLADGFPLITTKKLFTKGIVHELLWFLRGETNIKYLVDNGVHIWDDWADENGDLGPVYGSQWRDWRAMRMLAATQRGSVRPGEFMVAGAINGPISAAKHYDVYEMRIDQIANVMKSLRDNPDSRRHIVSAWNPAEVDQMALPPCHALFQFYVDDLTLEERRAYAQRHSPSMGLQADAFSTSDEEFLEDMLAAHGFPRKRLSCQLYQRSADMFLGVPFNIASYSLQTHMVAQQLGYAVGDFIWTGGDCHIYSNHMEQVQLQLTRTPRPYPTLKLNKAKDIYSYTFEDVQFEGYDPHPAIKGEVAV